MIEMAKTYWDGRFTTRPEAMDTSRLPTNYKFGEEVEVLLDTSTGLTVCGIINAVHFTVSTVSYDIAFKIEGTDVYAVLKGFRGHMRPKNCPEMFQDLTPVQDLVQALETSGVLDKLEPALKPDSNVVELPVK